MERSNNMHLYAVHIQPLIKSILGADVVVGWSLATKVLVTVGVAVGGTLMSHRRLHRGGAGELVLVLFLVLPLVHCFFCFPPLSAASSWRTGMLTALPRSVN